MKIVFFSRRFYPDIGGVEKHVYEISKELIKKGHEIIVITESEGFESSYQEIKIKRIKNTPDNWFKKFNIWKWIFINISVLNEANIIHIHDVFFWYLPFRFIFPFKKVYVTFHGYEGDGIPKRKAILMHKIAEKLSKGNICVGDYIKKWYGTNPTLVTYGAVDFPKVKHNQHKKKNKVIFLGRLEKETGILEYLKTMKLLHEKNIKLTLDVFGDGALRKKAENYSRKNNLNVNFMGFVSNASSLIGNYEYVFTSRFLGTLESFVFKRLVFCLYNNEIKKDCFYLSPFKNFIIIQNNPKKLSNQIQNYLNNPEEFDKNIEKAYDWVSKMTWKKLSNQYLELWKI